MGLTMMDPFPMMADVIPEGRLGVASVSHFTVTPEESEWSRVRQAVNPRGMEYVPPGRYAKLKVDGSLMMSDTPMERRSNREFLMRANGRILIAGLGLGMIVKAALNKPEFSEVVVVEKFADVAALVEPHVADPKLRVVVADIFEWRPARGERFDTIYFDIWPDICTDNLREIKTLHAAFRRYLDRNNLDRWMGSWMYDTLRYRSR